MDETIFCGCVVIVVVVAAAAAAAVVVEDSSLLSQADVVSIDREAVGGGRLRLRYRSAAFILYYFDVSACRCCFVLFCCLRVVVVVCVCVCVCVCSKLMDRSDYDEQQDDEC